MIQSEHMKSCLTAQKRFLQFKGPGSFKKIFKIGGNVKELKAYRLIPLTPPPPFSFYITFNIGCNKKTTVKVYLGNILIAVFGT